MSEAVTVNPTVSVIIPACNAAKYVGRAVSSALAQRNVVAEIIAVDDGSEDDTLQVLETFGPRIRILRQNRGGPYRARNMAASVAAGEWLAFLDADDEWLPDKLAKQFSLVDDRVGLVYTDRWNIGARERVSERQSEDVDLREGDVFEPLLTGNFITLSSVLMSKKWFDRLGGFETERKGVQDWDLWLRYAAAGGVVRLCAEALTRYRFHEEQMSNNLDERAADREAVLRRALQLPRGKEVSRRVIGQALAGVWQIGAWQAAPDHRLKAIQWYLRAAAYWPWNMRVYKEIIKCCLGRV